MPDAVRQWLERLKQQVEEFVEAAAEALSPEPELVPVPVKNRPQGELRR